MVFHKLHNSDDGASLNELAFNDARDALVKKIMDLQGGSKDEIIYYNNSGNE